MSYIYFDNAATGLPKSFKVCSAVNSQMKKCGNAGRSGHRFSENAARVLYECREELSAMFGTIPENTVLCYNATHALNMAVKGIALTVGGAALTSDLEHNSVMRPLYSLKERGIRTDVFKTDLKSDDETVKSFVSSIKEDTSFCVITHASNVCGRILPVSRLAKEAKKRGITVIVDASQTAGTIPIDLSSSDIDVLCFPGHKGLYGPLGTGVLLMSPKSRIDFSTIIEGGSGISSIDKEMPAELPERLEAGTMNAPAFAGLTASCRENEYCFEELTEKHEYITEGLKNISKATVYGESCNEARKYVPTVLINVKGKTPDELFWYLNENGIFVRSGLHCSPAAHRKLGTIDTGGVRISLGKHNKRSETDRLLKLLNDI